ncbi:cupin domain-containing protein [Nonomuraea sp. NPDC050643]|uniref:JmjC domain-containing protein n=1 Tax=Nonomuraea sp. NPDC050643 TaxID=3155660 RepID=UPI0033FC2516
MTGLAALVGDVDAFFERYLGRKALHRRGVAREVASLEDIDRVITGSGLRAPGLRVVKDGTVLPKERYVSPSTYGYAGLDDVVDPGKVAALFRDGATIVLGTADVMLPRLHELCKTIEMELGHPVDANAYVAPPGAQAFQVHCDAQDILVVQVHGDKRWTLFDHLEPDPAGGRMLPGLDAAATEYTLREGDVLYVPRGMPHLVRTETSASIHVSISVNTLTWADLLTALTSQLLRSGAYARPLPMGKDVAQQVEPQLKQYVDELAAALADPGPDRLHRAIHGRTACTEGHRAGLLAEALLGTPPEPGQRIALRPGTWPLITGEGARARIEAAGRTFGVTAGVAGACRRLRDGALPVSELSPDPAEAVRIAERLVELGLCTTSP